MFARRRLHSHSAAVSRQTGDTSNNTVNDIGASSYIARAVNHSRSAVWMDALRGAIEGRIFGLAGRSDWRLSRLLLDSSVVGEEQ